MLEYSLVNFEPKVQTTSHILMIRPVHFAFNLETAENNAFQIRTNAEDVQQKALEEFDELVAVLKNNNVDVITVEDTPHPHTPDSIFPNNWVSFHEDGTILLYPMYAPSRRAERKGHVLEKIYEKFEVTNTIDFTHYEKNNLFLEGTGSMVLDRENMIVFACISPRTDKKVLDDFCLKMNYRSIPLTAVDRHGTLIYHTNVMMCLADRYAIICLTSIPDIKEREQVVGAIETTDKEIIDISYDQMDHFAGNMLQIQNKQGEKLLVMSTQAYRSLTEKQVQKLNGFNKIIHSSLTTIEANGGGSARCMMAEIHLPVHS